VRWKVDELIGAKFTIHRMRSYAGRFKSCNYWCRYYQLCCSTI